MSRPYETSVTSPSLFRQKAINKKTFNQLYQDENWTSGVSAWGREELIAARVIFTSPADIIQPLRDFYPDAEITTEEPFSQFIDGPGTDDWFQIWDPELVQGTTPQCLGLVWAAVGGFSRRERLLLNPAGGSSRPTRPAAQISRQRTQEQLGQIRDFRASRGSSASSSSSGSLLGFVEPTETPLLERSTVRLISSMCEFFLVYGQSLSGTRPPMIWRYDTPVHSFIGGSTRRKISAVNDGGIQMWDPTRRVFRQIALLEAKRTLEVENGEPVVTDEVAGQIVGEALALHRSDSPFYVSASPNRSITIVATAYFIKFYHFEFPPSYNQNYEGAALTAHNHHLRVESTRWLSLQKEGDRLKIVRNLLAIINWGNSL
ncbi:hypothetical protein V8C35DRAFT_304062 [Trichoderma chlorosporum]